MFDHRIYVPEAHADALRQYTGKISAAYGGCTLYNGTGFWQGESDDSSGTINIQFEKVIVLSVLTGYRQSPDEFNQLKQELIEAGEECVLITKQEVEADFEEK